MTFNAFVSRNRHQTQLTITPYGAGIERVVNACWDFLPFEKGDSKVGDFQFLFLSTYCLWLNMLFRKISKDIMIHTHLPIEVSVVP